MGELLTRVGLLIIGFLIILGPLILLMGFLRLRERRESILLGVVLSELNSPNLRGLFAVDVNYGLFTRQGRVTIDLQDCSKEQIWEAIVRLSARLPLQVQLVVNGMTDSRSRSILTLNVKRSLPSAPSVCCCQ